MASNRGVVYVEPGVVEVRPIPFHKLEDPRGRKISHGVILRVVSTNICGSDQHMVRGRTTAPQGQVLGHEIAGEVIEVDGDVETLARRRSRLRVVQRRLRTLPDVQTARYQCVPGSQPVASRRRRSTMQRSTPARRRNSCSTRMT